MSHTLHFVATRADSPEEACRNIENVCFDWGGENNWFHICGCVSEKDEVHATGGRGVWSPEDENFNTIEKINKVATGWLEPDTVLCDENTVRALMKKAANSKDLTYSEWRDIERYSGQMCEVDGRTSLDVFKSDFRSGEFDEEGISSCYMDESNGTTRYVVFVDMHS